METLRVVRNILMEKIFNSYIVVLWEHASIYLSKYLINYKFIHLRSAQARAFVDMFIPFIVFIWILLWNDNKFYLNPSIFDVNKSGKRSPPSVDRLQACTYTLRIKLL